MKLLTSLVLVATVAWLGLGCSAERHVVGKWTTKPTEEQKSEGNPLANAASGLTVFELDVRQDKTFTLRMFGTGVDGTWTYSDDVITLTMQKAAGFDMSSLGTANKPWLGKLSEDRTKLEFKTEQGALSSALTFTRSPE